MTFALQKRAVSVSTGTEERVMPARNLPWFLALFQSVFQPGSLLIPQRVWIAVEHEEIDVRHVSDDIKIVTPYKTKIRIFQIPLSFVGHEIMISENASELMIGCQIKKFLKW